MHDSFREPAPTTLTSCKNRGWSDQRGQGVTTAVAHLAGRTPAGVADISFDAGAVKGAIDALGLTGSADHTVDETADLRFLPVQIKRAAVLLYRLTR